MALRRGTSEGRRGSHPGWITASLSWKVERALDGRGSGQTSRQKGRVSVGGWPTSDAPLEPDIS